MTLTGFVDEIDFKDQEASNLTKKCTKQFRIEYKKTLVTERDRERNVSTKNEVFYLYHIKSRHCVAYLKENYFASYGRPPPYYYLFLSLREKKNVFILNVGYKELIVTELPMVYIL